MSHDDQAVSDLKPVLERMTRVSLLAGSLGGGEHSDRPPYDVEVLALFDRCRSLLGAVRLLLAHNFVHEAVMLGRPLFTDSLALAEFAAVDERRRGELVVGRASPISSCTAR